MTDKTAIQRIKELDHERATLFEQAKEEALRRATQAVEDLNALGLKYRLVEGAAPAGNKSTGKKPQETSGAEKKASYPAAGLNSRCRTGAPSFIPLFAALALHGNARRISDLDPCVA
jgi:hypothetical protein